MTAASGETGSSGLLSSFELRHVRAFVEVVEQGTVSAAAERLRVAQPALSRTVMQLERSIGAQLFARRAQRLALTDAGRAFLPEARLLLSQASAAMSHAQRAARGEVGRLTIAFTESAMYSGIVATTVRRFSTAFPSALFDLRELSTAEQVAALLAQDIDIAFVCGRTVSMPASLNGRRVLEDRLVAAVPEGHPLAHHDQISVSDLATEALVLPRTYLALGLHKAVRDAWAAAGLIAPPIQDAAQLHTVVSLVSARVGLGLVPASMREFRPTGVTYLPLTGLPFTITTNAVWRDDDPSVTIQRFLALIPNNPDMTTQDVIDSPQESATSR